MKVYHYMDEWHCGARRYKLKIGTIFPSVPYATRYTNEMEKVLIFLLILGLMVIISESFFITRRDLRRSWNLLPRWFNQQPKQQEQDRQDYYGSGEERDRADDYSSDHSHGRHSKRFHHHHHHKKGHHHCGHHDHDHDHHHYADDHYYKSKYNDDHYRTKYNDDHYRTKYNDDRYKTKYNDEHYRNRSNEDKNEDEDYYEDDRRNVQQKRKNNEDQPKQGSRRERPRTRSSTTTPASPEDYPETDNQQQDDTSRSVQPQQHHQYRYASNHPAMQYKKDYVAGVLVTIPNIRNGDDLEPYFQRAKYNNPFFETFLRNGQEYAPEETIARPLYYNFE